MIDDDEVKAIAKLARINIDDPEIPGYAQDLSKIIDFIAQMNAVDTSAIEPLAHPLELEAPLRADQVSESDQRDTYQAQAPEVREGLYLVPKVIE